MSKRMKLFLCAICVFAVIFAFAMVASATEYTVTSNSEFSTATSSAQDGDTIIIKSSISETLDFGKSITYILDGNNIVWTAGVQNTATGKAVKILSKNGNNSFKPNASMWCNSYGLTVANLSSTSWTIGSADTTSTLLLDLDVVDGRLFYGTFLKEINLLPGTTVTNLYSTNSSGDTNYLKCTTLNMYENVRIYGNSTNKPIIDVTTFNMFGGEISGNVCIGMWSDVNATTFNMYGGSIHDNYQPSPHSIKTNASDPQSVAFVNAKDAFIYDGEIYGNFVGLGHDNETKGTAAGISSRNNGVLYVKDGAINENILVTLGSFGTFSLDSNGHYTCEIDPSEYHYVTDNGDGTYTYERQYTYFKAVTNFDYSVIFKNANSSIINAYMLHNDGAIVRAYDKSEAVTVPADVEAWSEAMNSCVEATATTDKQSTYYVAHVRPDDDSDCSTAVICSLNCGKVFVEAKVHNILPTIAYPNDDYTVAGTKTVICLNDGCNHGVGKEPTEAKPIFVFKGYSKSENLTSLCVGYYVNTTALNEFEASTNGKKLSHGVIATIPDTEVTEYNPLAVSGGIVTTVKDKSIHAPLSGSNYAQIDFVIRGFSEKDSTLKLVMCGYIFDGESIYYLCGNGMQSSASLIYITSPNVQ